MMGYTTQAVEDSASGESLKVRLERKGVFFLDMGVEERGGLGGRWIWLGVCRVLRRGWGKSVYWHVLLWGHSEGIGNAKRSPDFVGSVSMYSIAFGVLGLGSSQDECHRLSFYCNGTQILQPKNGCRTNKTVKTNNSRMNTMHDGSDCSVHPLDDYANRQHNFSFLDHSNLAPTFLSACTQHPMPRLTTPVECRTLAGKTAINLAAAIIITSLAASLQYQTQR